MRIKTDKVMQALSFENRRQMADFFGLHRQAAYQWGEYLPTLRAYELLEKRPDLRRLVEDRG